MARLSVEIPSTFTTTEAEEGELLSPLAMLFREPQFNLYIIYVLGFGKILSSQQIKAGLEVTLLRHPRFSSIQVTDSNSWRREVRWVPTKVNLDEHVVFPDSGPEAAAAAGDPTVGDLYVENYTSGLCRSLLDPSRPLWDLHILAIRTSEAPAVAVFRLHHSLGDGISLMSLLHACTHRTSDPDSLPFLPEVRRRPAGVVARNGPLMFLCWIWTFLSYAWNTLVEVCLLASTMVFLKDTKTPIKGKEGVEYRPKRFVHRTLCLDEINAIKNTIGCTINDVLVGVASAALSRHLSRSYGGILPKDLRIRASLAVNIRPLSGIHNLAEMMKKDSQVKWGNRIAFYLLRLPVTKFEDPLDYVRKVTEITKKKKKSMAAIFTYAFLSMICDSLGSKVAMIFVNRIFLNTTLAFSNIVGPAEEIGFCGSPLLYIAPTVYGNQQALTIHLQSYWNKIKVVLAVDEHAIPDPHSFLDDIVDSLQVIKDAAISII